MTDDPKMQAEVQPDVRKNPRRIAFILRRTSPHVKTQDDVRGIEKERNRWNFHIAKAPFYDHPLETITKSAVRDLITSAL